MWSPARSALGVAGSAGSRRCDRRRWLWWRGSLRRLRRGIGFHSRTALGGVGVNSITPGLAAAPLAVTAGECGSRVGLDVAVLVAEAPATAPVANPAAASATVAMVPPMATPMVVLRPMVSMALYCQLRACSVKL